LVADLPYRSDQANSASAGPSALAYEVLLDFRLGGEGAGAAARRCPL